MPLSAPPVTVLMCVYNGARYLCESVESILNQTMQDFEFLIIDDGSTDETPSILRSYRDRRLHVIREEHRGLTASLQLGIQRARGEFIARIDADDKAHPDRLRLQLEFLKRHPTTLLVVSDACGIDEDGNVLWHTHLPGNGVEVAWRLLFYNCIVHSSVMFRAREVLDLGGYDAHLAYAQDYSTWIRVARISRIGVLRLPLVQYRIHRHQTISVMHGHEQQECIFRVQEATLALLDPELTTRIPEVQMLGAFLYLGGPPPQKIDEAEQLCKRLFAAFCNSTFASGATPEQMRLIMREPLMSFAWQYLRGRRPEDCKRCLQAALVSAPYGTIHLPEDLLDQAYDMLRNILIQKDIDSSFLHDLHTSVAWQYCRSGDIRKFRRCLLRAWWIQKKVSSGLVWLISFAGKRFLDECEAMRRQLTMLLRHRPAD